VKRAKPSPPLSALQLRWLGLLLLCAQMPLLDEVLPWVAAGGVGLVLVRLLPATQGAARALARRWVLPLLAACVALGLRAHLGYFLARDPCVQFLFVLVGIKFVESRTARDGSLLVCLAMFLSITQFFYAQTIFAALMAIPALLALGATLCVLRTGVEAPERRWQPLLQPLRLLLQGIPLAAFMFILFPRLAGPLWGSPADTGARTGLSDRMSPGAISELSRSDAVAFRVSFRGVPPPNHDRYWRGPVFARFNGREWSPLLKLQPGRFARGEGIPIEYTVMLEPHGKLWLFALETPAGLPRPATDESVAGPVADIAFYTYDRQILARTSVSQAVRYTLRSVVRGTSAPAPGDESDNLLLPRNNNRTLALARELRAQSDSDADYIRRVLARFHDEPYVYTLTPPLLEADANPVDAFLFETRRGFCEHYAGAFVLMLRGAGIPARVVTGYQGGEMSPDGDYMIVRQSDAHAWAEAIVDGRWQRFDPTAAVAPSRVELGLGAALPLTEPVPYLARLEMTWLKSVRLQWDAINYQWQRGVVGFNLDRQRELLRDLGIEYTHPAQLTLIIVLVALAWVGAVLGLARARRGRADAEVALWSQLCKRLARAGLARRPDEGPLAYAERAGIRFPAIRSSLADIALRYATLRYGPARASDADGIDELAAAIAALPSARRLAAST
jgi:transglutaminase-like putative cysteine protease